MGRGNALIDSVPESDFDLVEFVLRLRALTTASTVSDIAQSSTEVARWAAATPISWFGMREGETLEMRGQDGLWNPAISEAWHLPIGTGIGGRVALDGNPVAVRDYARDPRRVPVLKKLIDTEEMHSSICVPVQVEDEIFGVLYVAERKLRTFTDDEVELVAAIGKAAGAAIKRITERDRLAATVAGQTSALEGLQAAQSHLREILDAGVTASDGSAGIRSSLRLLAAQLGAEATVVDEFGSLLYSAGESPGGSQASALLGGENLTLGELQIGTQRPLSSEQRVLLDDAAGAMTLMLLRKRAALEARLHLDSEFLSGLLNGFEQSEEDAFIRRASVLGFDLCKSATVVCIGLHSGIELAANPDDSAPGKELRDVIDTVAHRVFERVIVSNRGAETVLVARLDESSSVTTSRAVRQLIDDVAVAGHSGLSAGVGRACTRLGDYGTSYSEASLGLLLARSRPTAGAVVSPSDLGLYALFGHKDTRQTLESVIAQTLGPLIEADEKAQSEYVKTLASFLANDRHLENTASELFIHVNTLRYRISKIQAIIGVDLRDVDSRFLIELAMRARSAIGER